MRKEEPMNASSRLVRKGIPASFGIFILTMIVVSKESPAALDDGLQAYYRLDEALGFTAADASGNGRSAALVTFRRDSPTFETDLFLNGASIAINRLGGNTQADDSLYPLIAGKDAAGSKPFDGLIDDIRIYNRVLTAAEIAALAQPANQPPALSSAPSAMPNPEKLGGP